MHVQARNICSTSLPRSFYVVPASSAKYGFYNAGDATTNFDVAVDDWIAARQDDEQAKLIFVDLSTGTARDLTNEALERAHHFWRCNRQEPPDWALTEDEIADRKREDIAVREHVQIESRREVFV